VACDAKQLCLTGRVVNVIRVQHCDLRRLCVAGSSSETSGSSGRDGVTRGNGTCYFPLPSEGCECSWHVTCNSSRVHAVPPAAVVLLLSCCCCKPYTVELTEVALWDGGSVHAHAVLVVVLLLLAFCILVLLCPTHDEESRSCILYNRKRSRVFGRGLSGICISTSCLLLGFVDADVLWHVVCLL
jgi:hypothetical protein